MNKGLEVWNAVKKYLNLYHHQAVKENIDVKTVEGMSIDIIEKSLKSLEIIKEKTNLTKTNDGKKALVFVILENQAEFDLLKEVLL